MIQNYLKIFWRNFKKNKIFSFVNSLGLSLGLACCMAIALYLYHEFSYDQYNRNIDRLYQVGTEFILGNDRSKSPNTPAPFGPTIQKEYPEIEAESRLLVLFNDDKTLLQFQESSQQSKSFYESGGYLADSSFFNLFDYNFSEGNAATSLLEPNSLVLSQEIARKFFGSGSAMGKIIHINSNTNGSADYRVTGVFIPNVNPSHIDARFFLSMSSGDFGHYTRTVIDFASNNLFQTYLLMKPGINEAAFQSKLPSFVKKYMQKDLSAAGFGKRQFLLPVKDIHLRSGMNSNVTDPGSLSYLYILSSIAVFILLIACINFMNLATARSIKRAAEVGIRKVLGAERNALIRQFLTESLLLSFFSFIIAIILISVFLPLFSRMAGFELSFHWQQHKYLLLGSVALTLATGLLAGTYPAFYLSAFKPIKVMKGKFSNSLSAVNIRKILVVFQFTISAALIIAAIVIGRQMNYLQSKDMGFIKDQQVVIPLRTGNSKGNYVAFKNEVLRNEQVIKAGGSLFYPGISNPSDMLLHVPGKTMKEAIDIKMNWVDGSFLQTLGIKPLTGRIFSVDFSSDTSSSVILNEQAVKKLGFRTNEEILNKELLMDWQGNTYRYTVIGVVKDFNFESLQQPITPYGFQMNNHPNFNYLVVHSRAGNMHSLLGSLENVWKRLDPSEPFEYSFLDQNFQKNYEKEERLSAMVGYFMFIGIFICCLGLFGLAAFSAEQRTKEIGVRKVLGSSVFGIVTLLSGNFLKWVTLGNLIGLPLAWYFMHQWLQQFAYQVELSWWIFFAGIMVSILIALMTVSFQAIKAAIANPVTALRSE